MINDNNNDYDSAEKKSFFGCAGRIFSFRCTQIIVFVYVQKALMFIVLDIINVEKKELMCLYRMPSNDANKRKKIGEKRINAPNK